MPIRAVISDFGGVLTSSLTGAFARFQEDTGVTLEQLGTAMSAGAGRLDGRNPLFELECGRISEERFLDILRDGLEPLMGERPALHRFKETYFDGLHPNREMIALMAELSGRGYRMAIIPIRWFDKRGSRMRASAALAVRVAWDLFRIPFLHRGSRRRAAEGA